MYYLPEDVISYIKNHIYDYDDLLNLKNSCSYFNSLISRSSLTKLILKNKILFYKPINLCININCYDDTIDIFEDVYYVGYSRYIHTHQPALNTNVLSINNRQYKITTPYCCECFKQYILIGP